MILPRPQASRRIRDGFERPGPAILLVIGRRRAGKTFLLRQTLSDASERRTLWFRPPPVPDLELRRLFRRELQELLSASPNTGTPERASRAAKTIEDEADTADGLAHCTPNGTIRKGEGRGADATPGRGAGEPPEEWGELLDRLHREIARDREPAALIVDGWERLYGAQGRFIDAFEAFWSEIRRRDLPLHLVVSSRSGPATEPFREEGTFEAWVTDRIEVGLLPLRPVLDLLRPRGERRDRLRFALVFGGMAPVWAAVPSDTSLRDSLIDAVLRPGAPLLGWGEELLEAELQSPARYASLLSALARGPAEWGEIRKAAAGFSSGAQLAPYLRRLEEMGLVRVRRSLDAGPRSRNRRYGLTDPFTAFWFRFVLPHLGALERGKTERIWKGAIRPHLDDHLSRHFPQLCRRFVRDHADERWGVKAREVGGLWGPGYELPVAGTLRNGAVLYGKVSWKGTDAGALDEIARARRETRYGFGREARIRVVFTGTEPTPKLLRLAARDPFVEIVPPDGLTGSEG